MSFEYADNRPVLMDPKHPTPVKTWDCGGNDAGIVRIMEGQTEDGPCETNHPHKGAQKAKKRFRRIKECNARSGILRSEGDKNDEDF